MVEIRTHRDHPSSMAERVQKRRRNSGDAAHADSVTTGDKGTITNIHNSRVQQYGEGVQGTDISGNRRGQV